MNEAISEKAVTVAENMEKVFAAGARSTVPTIELTVEEQDNTKKTYKVYGYTEEEYNDATNIPLFPVFDLEIEKLDGTPAKYKVLGYEVRNEVV